MITLPRLVLAILLLTLAGAFAGGTEITHIDGRQAVRLVAEQKPFILDVRTPQEYGLAHINGSTNIDFKGKDFESQVARLDKKQTVLLHCASGARSLKALETFKKLGFAKVIHLDGGFSAYEEAKEAAAK